MKKIIAVLVVISLSLVVIIPVSANGNGSDRNRSTNSGTVTLTGIGKLQQGARATFAITGRIAAIGASTITIDVLRGNTLARSYLGSQVTITVTSDTRYLYKDGMTTTPNTFAELMQGQPVSVNGTVAKNIWNASRITVGASLSCLP